MYNHELDKKPEQTTFNSMYRGEVVNNEDPNQDGRCQIRIFGVYDNIDDILYLPSFDGIFYNYGIQVQKKPGKDAP